VEVRRCLQWAIDKSWLGTSEGWAGIQTIIQIDSERHIQGETTNETRYYISSLGLDAQRANQVVRNHWAIENSLHWTLDMTFREDKSRIRRGDCAQVMNAMRKVALNIVRNNTTRKHQRL
jgi:predicted transposase YbfD/YdcC